MLTNRSNEDRLIELTSYAEPVLAPPYADLAHPAFANLFVETELVAGNGSLLATRRPRRPDEPRRWLVHLMAVRDGASDGRLSWETDRRAFIGRGRTLASPAALSGPVGVPLGGTLGAVLDPALALRRVVRVPARGRVVVDVLYGATEQRDAAISMANRYSDAHLADRIFGLSWTHGQVVLAQLGATEREAQVFGRLAGSLTLPTFHRRAASEILRNRRTRSGLWSHGISGDLPIMLLRVTDGQRLDLVREALRAHAWWRTCGLAVDLVVLIEDPSLYRQEVAERVIGLVTAGPTAGQLDRPGGIFIRRIDQVAEEDRHLLAAAARLVVTAAGGSLAQFAERRVHQAASANRVVPLRQARTDAAVPPPSFDLQHWNGLGGFTRDGQEYIILLPPGTTTPLPWCNVLTNAQFGTVISERGAAYTWWGNCHEFRLTPWRCDAVIDPHGEALFLRDEDTGSCWSPTPGPLPCGSTRVVRHGFGYSAYMAGDEGIASELHIWVDAIDPVKHQRLRLINRSSRPRRLTVLCWQEWTLGELRERTAAGLITEHDDGVLYARNSLHDDFPSHSAFLTVNRKPLSWTCDRSEFVGRGGSSARPAALTASRLLGRAGAALDPCAALQMAVDLEPGQEEEIVFTLGCGRDRGHAASLAQSHRSLAAAAQSLERIYAHWKDLLGRIRVRTSDPSLDLLANGWLAYQVVASRILARSGFSQSGGAWGFRDQLQDAMAMVLHEPRLLREQLIRCAGRQFSTGDVQHWWHPPAGRGVRTRISDDFLWLTLALSRYLEATGDRAILLEQMPFLDAPQVPADQESLYDLPNISTESGTLYEHAARAILHGMRYGEHGLPLMGTGDWNDGMDRVGHHGKGESVWLAFFLCEVMRRFARVAREFRDVGFADRLLVEAEALSKRIDVHAWEGDHYLRAWMDNGTPLGSAHGEECRIDALPQAWAALTGACRPERAVQAMQQVDRLLVRRAEGLIQLFDPPFDHGSLEPGYIKGYVPGVRENGGQYTHAAVWTAMGFAALGDGAKALELTRLLDPIRHGADPARWQGEPYVLAADVYRTAGHIGRAGWTWYTGSAGWMLRLVVESLLGLTREADKLILRPCLPHGFGSFEITYRQGSSAWLIAVEGDGPVRSVHVDGMLQADGRIPLDEDGREHRIAIRRG
jgi:cyclic beta-1,2-glucan synthetase